MTRKIAIDSNALTFLVDAMMGRYNPKNDSEDLLLQKVSLLRIFIYCGTQFYVLPTVEMEYKRIKNVIKLEEHKSICEALLFDGIFIPDEILTNIMIDKYSKKHTGLNDCKILAEANQLEVETLLTYDFDFYNNLRTHSDSVTLAIPSEYWNSLYLPVGTSPIWSPHESNPLSKQTWWVLE
ncbi:MAG: type II toxin-antitoxin system VapC family toxin [Desulfurivibrionaceae bacterium]|jgi:hypothetical protein